MEVCHIKACHLSEQRILFAVSVTLLQHNCHVGGRRIVRRWLVAELVFVFILQLVD